MTLLKRVDPEERYLMRIRCIETEKRARAYVRNYTLHSATLHGFSGIGGSFGFKHFEGWAILLTASMERQLP